MTTFKEALIQYENENEDGKIRLIYSYFGLAIYFSQILEETFSTMLWTNRVFKKKIKTSKELNEIIDTIENSKKTMGVFINEIKQSYNLDEKLRTDLDKMLKDRNFLVHKYFKIEIQKCFSEIGKKEMLEFFGNFIDQSKKIDSELQKYYVEYKIRMGVTEEKIEEIVNEMKQTELKREKNYSQQHI